MDRESNKRKNKEDSRLIIMKKIFWVLLLVGIFGIFRSIQFNDKDNELLNSSELGVFMNNVRQDDFPKKRGSYI